MSKVIQILKHNNYPSNFIDQNIKIRLGKIRSFFNSNHNARISNKNKYFLHNFNTTICLPFVERIFKKLSSCLKVFNISTIPIVNKNSSSVIKLGKDSTNTMERTNVVYRICCKDCEAYYISETKKSLKTRIKEHINNKNNESVVCQHKINFGHEFDCNRTVVVDAV